MSSSRRVEFAVDTGGTFTDVICKDHQGNLRVNKLLSSPQDPSESIDAGMRELLQELSHPCYRLTHGTTVATNALLERRGAHTAFVTTAGFEDLLELGRQARPELYALHVKKEPHLVSSTDCFGVQERVNASGEILEELTSDEMERLCDVLEAKPYEAIAVCLLHGYLYPGHEQRLVAALRERFPERFVCASSEIVREMREYERSSTTVMNAYVGPVMKRYLSSLKERLHDADAIHVFESSGARVSLSRASNFPVHTTLSGPAGGVMGALQAANEVGITDIITFDMGGTSTDVALCKGSPTLRELGQVGHMPVQVPMLDIHTVGAGGGSIAHVDAGGALKVGPQSAGASPGPVCYQRGGNKITVTDAHVVLGRLRPDHFLGGEMHLDRAASVNAMQSLADGLHMPVSEVALGVLQVADAAMVRAIKVISLERGEDPREYTLVSFGGAGGLHACRLAKLLGIRKVLIPANPGLLSAYGMLHAKPGRRASRTFLVSWHKLQASELVRQEVCDALHDVSSQARSALAQELEPDVLNARQLVYEPVFEVRYQGQSFALKVALNGLPDDEAHLASLLDVVRAQFEQEHERLYGWLARERDLELVMMRCTVSLEDVVSHEEPSDGLRDSAEQRLSKDAIVAEVDVTFDPSGAQSARVIQRDALVHGDCIRGPAVMVEYSGTTVIPAGWRGEVRGSHVLLHDEEGE